MKRKHRNTWASGDYDQIARGIIAVADHVVRAARVRAGERVLDVACGTGNTALAARARGAEVAGLDLTPELLAVAGVPDESSTVAFLALHGGPEREHLLSRPTLFEVAPVVPGNPAHGVDRLMIPDRELKRSWRMEKPIVDGEGKLTIPAHVLSRRGLRPGDELLLVEADEGLLLYQRGAGATAAWEGETDHRPQSRADD